MSLVWVKDRVVPLLAGAATVLVAMVGCSRARSEPISVDTKGAAPPLPDAAPPSVSSAAASARPPTSPPGPMILLRGGTFRMGTDGVGPGTEDMGPEHTVKLADFRLDVTEVTVAAYRGCVNAGSCTEAGRKFNGPYQQGCMWDDAGLGTNPINCVTWPQADAYCKWAGKELPTEEQWEYAARGRNGRDFPWGMAIPGHDNWGAPDDVDSYIAGCAVGWQGAVFRAACPVGSAPKGNTPEGVKDMAGNVAEWTASIYCKYDNPRCGGEKRVVRGGTNHSAGRRLVGTFRAKLEPNWLMDELGFRCAQPVEKGSSP